CLSDWSSDVCSSDLVNENAKQWAFAFGLPEFDHNGIQGMTGPTGSPPILDTLILDAPAIHPRNRLRVRRTAELMQQVGASARVRSEERRVGKGCGCR